MMQKHGKWLLVFLFLVGMPITQAATPIVLSQATFQQIKQQFFQITPNTKGFTALPIESLQLINQHQDQNQIQHIRMQQYYAGIEVFGGYAIFHSAQDLKGLLQSANQVRMNGQIYEGLAAELGQPPIDLSAKQSLALQQFQESFPAEVIRASQINPMIYIDEANKAYWAFKISLLLERPGTAPERPSVILDAVTFQPFVQWDEIKTTHTSVRGVGYGGNTKVGEYHYGKHFPFLQLNRDSKSKQCYLENKEIKVVDMEENYYTSNKTMKFDCQNSIEADLFKTGYAGDGYDKVNGAFSPSNDALYAGTVITKLYREWYGIPALSKDNKPMKLIMRVHFGEQYANAFWDGEQMTFGDGDTRMFPLVSLGISAHEVSHGFTEQHSNLAYFRQAGGINESFSDMAAQAAEFFATGVNSWQIGSEIMKKSTGRQALRYLDRPSRDGISIESAKDYVAGMDVHFSSGVFNRLFYLLAHKPHWNIRKAFDVMVKANMDYWIPTSTFEEAACGVISAAMDFRYEIAELKQALAQVDVDYSACKNSIS